MSSFHCHKSALRGRERCKRRNILDIARVGFTEPKLDICRKRSGHSKPCCQGGSFQQDAAKDGWWTRMRDRVTVKQIQGSRTARADFATARMVTSWIFGPADQVSCEERRFDFGRDCKRLIMRDVRSFNAYMQRREFDWSCWSTTKRTCAIAYYNGESEHSVGLPCYSP